MNEEINGVKEGKVLHRCNCGKKIRHGEKVEMLVVGAMVGNKIIPQPLYICSQCGSLAILRDADIARNRIEVPESRIQLVTH